MQKTSKTPGSGFSLVQSARPSSHFPKMFLLFAIGAFFLDQFTKVLALKFLETGGPKTPLLGKLISLQLISNPGAAFSFASGYTWIFSILPVVILIALGYLALYMRNPYWVACIGALAGGAAGNLVDRLIRPPGVFRGEVVDFINYCDWFIGNVADIAIVLAVVGIVLLSLLEVPSGMNLAAQDSGDKEEN